MTQIDTIVQVNITQDTKAVSKPSFAIPLLMSQKDPGWTSGDDVHSYTGPSGMLTDGFVITDPEYSAALALTSQDVQPVVFLVGRRQATTGAVDGFDLSSVIVETPYHLTIDGTLTQYVPSDTNVQTTLQGLLGVILADADVGPLFDGTASVVQDMGGGTFRLKLVALAGAPTYTNYSQLTKVHISDPHNVVGDLNTIRAQNDTWYGYFIVGGTEDEVETAAEWTEAQKKIQFASNFDSSIASSDTTDLFSRLKTAGYKRTIPCYMGDAKAPPAWMGGQLPQVPGSNNWAFKTLNGVSTDVLTDTSVANVIGLPVEGIKGKNGNVYTSIAGINMTRMGTCASGDYIDNVIGIDWLHAEIQTRVFANLAGAKKVPYTNAGVAILISSVRAGLDQGAANGLLDPGSLSVSAPDVLTVSQNDRANRIAPPIAFEARLQGAFNAVKITGIVSV